MYKKWNTCLLICCLTTVSGCAALTPAQSTISVTTNIPDAAIMINGENVGAGSISTSVHRNKNVSIVAIKDGYHAAYRTIGKHNNLGGILDAAVCGFGLIIFALPWCISAFAAPGAWSLDETDISLYMIPDNSK